MATTIISSMRVKPLDAVAWRVLVIRQGGTRQRFTVCIRFGWVWGRAGVLRNQYRKNEMLAK